MVAATLLLASCVKTPEQKAEVLIKEHLQKSLYHPDTYAPSETLVDSAFAPYDDPEFYEKTLKLAKLGVAITKFDSEASFEKSNMAISSGPYQTAYDRNSYREAKDKYDKAMAKIEKAKKEAAALSEELKKMKEQKETFIGFIATHSYRANNNAGQTVSGNMEFLFDKDMKGIVATYDMDSEEYKAVTYLYKMMRGETSIADEVNLEE